MLAMLQDLIRHKGHANACLLKAIRQHEPAAQDRQLRKLLHHIILANRFWLSLTLGRPFDREVEARMPETLDAVTALYRETHVQELEWVSRATESELDRFLETPRLPGRSVSVAQAWVQVCMHSQGHRSQCATKLRELGGTPPATDFVLWVKDRPPADWS
jgi:uncharacterized damage-inducible protein DinB